MTAFPPRRHRLLPVLLVLLLGLTLTSGARADTRQTSLMQDDQFLIDSGPRAMLDTLATMQRLGVQTVRVNVEWANIAPDPGSRTAPAGFGPGQPGAADPASYPAANWAPYDRLAAAAPLYGITVQYNLTGPAPLWATAPGAPTTRAATHWKPSATDFYDFVFAIGTRYDGQHGEPRVSQWSIWNEPNQPGWIAPQWLKVHGHSVPQSPRIYRALVNSGYYGLLFSGHSTRTDTVLVGETAPEGQDSGGFYTAMTPLPFLRALYCVDARLRPLRGAGARALGCPTRGSARAFARANAGLFRASGFAHHPYDFLRTPAASLPDANDAPLSDIGRLERFLDRTFAAYGVHRHIPLYFTEYGYETRPPDPHRGVSLATQAGYLNEADYMAWRDPRVRSVAQFLLVDSAPNPAFTPSQYGYWDTFQTGLEFLDGTAKPALSAYRMPLWLPRTHVHRGRSVFVWGQVRPADALAGQPVRLQWRGAHGRWRTLAGTHTASHSGYFTVAVHLPGSGYVRSLWHGTIAGTPVTLTSRRVPVLVRR